MRRPACLCGSFTRLPHIKTPLLVPWCCDFIEHRLTPFRMMGANAMLVLVGVSLVLSACNPAEDRTRLNGEWPVETVATGEVTASVADQSTPYIATPDEALVPIGSAKCDIGYVVLPHGGRLVPDPAIFAIDGSFLYSEVYSGLTRLDPITGDVETELADSYASSNDGRSYTFRLREGLRFSDGSPV